MEVSSPSLPCVVIRTSEAINYPKSTSISTPPVIVEEQEEWEVAQVLDSKLKRGKLWYLVEWKGFSEDPERTLGSQLPTLTTHQTLSGISTHCILVSLVQIPQEFDLWCLVGRRSYKVSSSPGMHL
ncbi:hypothetical protein O181_014127 [Austropuccinia psidii MF-1]|uniref:Chromo domain-containing protein n=1 Tax=Austropuccinia psidii MF-1 TaxID=1389203 RepID=A0A9Q3BZL7_9BASI|nr:hypothetical protein [Austropuccinia psidii MF-1]